MYTSYALFRNVEQAEAVLRFKDFEMRPISTPGDMRDLKELFGTIFYNTYWLYVRTYDGESSDENALFRRISRDVEDTLLKLLLFKSGDLCLMRQTIRDSQGKILSPYPHRFMSDAITANHYRFGLDDVESFNHFCLQIESSSGWDSGWFRTARNFFLYGAAKEFHIEAREIDRILDYVIALEAVLAPEKDLHISARVRNRAVKLLGSDDHDGVSRLLRDAYSLRSKIAHGNPVIDDDALWLRNHMQRFEEYLRKIIVNALVTFPADDAGRKAKLKSLHDVTDTDRKGKIEEIFESITSLPEKQALLRELSEKLQHQPSHRPAT